MHFIFNEYPVACRGVSCLTWEIQIPKRLEHVILQMAFVFISGTCNLGERELIYERDQYLELPMAFSEAVGLGFLDPWDSWLPQAAPPRGRVRSGGCGHGARRARVVCHPGPKE